MSMFTKKTRFSHPIYPAANPLVTVYYADKVCACSLPCVNA